MVFIKSQKSGSKPRMHGAAYSTSPMWNECKKEKEPAMSRKSLGSRSSPTYQDLLCGQRSGSNHTFMPKHSARTLKRKDIEPYS